MHGHYDSLHSKGNDARDLKTGDISTKKLGANFRFASNRSLGENPWARTAPINGDFILIAEFSENEGPIPVMTIPKNGGVNFDINAFAVHVMSVDYTQARGANFSLVEDTQLLLSEKKDGIYAYVHHFTLYDIHARGFVRPFCMCYISRCKRKMLAFLDHLMDEFTKVSRLFRHGNRITFLQDLEQRLAEVLAMRDSCSFRNINTEGPVCQKWMEMEKSRSNVKEEYERILKETKKLIEVLKPHMQDSRIVQQFKRLESMTESRTRSLTDACDPDLLRQRNSDHMLSYLVKQQPVLRKAFSLPDMKSLLAGQKEVRSRSFLPYLNNVKQLRHLHELCEWGAKEGLNRLRTILKHYSRETSALLIEQTETSHLERLPSLLTVGRSVVCNFLHKIDMKCVNNPWTKETPHDQQYQGSVTRCSSNGSLYSLESFQSCVEDELVGSAMSSDGILSPFAPSSLFHMDLQGTESSSYGSSVDSKVDNSDVMSIHSDVSLPATRERLSLEEYALVDEDIFSEYSDARFRRQRNEVLEPNIGLQQSYTSGISRSLGSISAPTSNYSVPRYSKHFKKTDERNIRRSNPVAFAKREKMTKSLGEEVSPRNAGNKNNLSVRNTTKRSKSDGRFGSCTVSSDDKPHRQSLPSNFRPDRIKLRCFAEEVTQPLESYTGSNVLFLHKNMSLGVHLLYALLCGRPVVVLAEPCNERDLRLLISALWMFVPENTNYGKAIVPWRTKPLQIADLAWLKLVGLAKNKHMNMVPKSVKRYVSVLNFETDLIETPPYKGHYLRSFCNFSNQWPTNSSLVAFVHSVFLELANKSYIYYYAYCLEGLECCFGKSSKRADSGHADEMRDASEILSRLRVHFSDAKIVQYFAELVKQQQVEFHQTQAPEQDFSTEAAACDPDSLPENALIIADLSKCAVFRNVKPLDSF